jgi:3'-phosphoadenosine 5'-phosphosulfate (PAPS) 3'-phosphatase
MKIFGIGLSKTGTTSLAHALGILGFKIKDCLGVTHYSPGDLSSINSAALESYDALTDTPIPSFYKELDSRYPGSKFILTIRDIDAWLMSCKKQFNDKLAAKQTGAHNHLFLDLYGTIIFDEEKFRAGYLKFVDGVYEYFKERPQDLLVMNVAAGDGWEKLCPFLGKEIPDAPFPKANVTKIRWMRIDDLVSVAQEAGDELLDILGIANQKIISKTLFTSRSIRQLINILKRLKYSIFGSLQGRQEALSRDILFKLTKGIRSLYPDIPIVSRFNHDIPYVVRSNWSHFWLIDVSKNLAQMDSQHHVSSINIALIEDRKPVVGIVYDPLSQVVYYAMSWKGAYRIKNGDLPIKLGFPESRPGNSNPISLQGEPTAYFRNMNPSQHEDISLQLCRIADGTKRQFAKWSETKEWQTAAGHAIISTLGYKLMPCQEEQEVLYNKADWKTPFIELQ